MSLANKTRMLVCAVVSILLFIASLTLQQLTPSSLLAVSLFKLHLLSVAAWAGYWVDRGLFPYARPHKLLEADPDVVIDEPGDWVTGSIDNADWAMMRRALIVFACIIGVCLGA